MLKGFDVYHGDDPFQFHAAKDAGYDFVILKATQGLIGIDTKFADYRIRAHDAGFVVGSYHYLTLADPIAQAQHYLSVAKPVKGELVMALDVETYFDGVAENALACANEIKRVTGRFPIIYSGASFFNSYLAQTFPDSDYTLWIAKYGPAPKDINWAFWQDSENGEIDSFARPIDTDVFNGELADLLTHTIT